MRFCETDDTDHQRRIGEAALFDIDLGRRGVRIFPREHLRDHFAAANARVTLEHNETPRRQLAVIGHPRTDGEYGFKLGGGGGGTTHLAAVVWTAGFLGFRWGGAFEFGG